MPLSLPTEAVTQLLSAWHQGDDTALERLTPLIYQELRRMAAHFLDNQPAGHTLQPTALVHEFYLRADGLRDIEWQNRAHFIGTAARVMRNILVDHARRKTAGKRSGKVESLTNLELPVFDASFDLVDLDDALHRLSAEFPRHAKVVELLFFGGLSSAEAAHVLDADGTAVSSRTVERDWRFAKAWLLNEISAT